MVLDMMTTTLAIFAPACAAVMVYGGVGIIVLKCYDKSGHLTPCKSIGYVPPHPPNLHLKSHTRLIEPRYAKNTHLNTPKKQMPLTGLCARFTGMSPKQKLLNFSHITNSKQWRLRYGCINSYGTGRQ